MIGLFISFVGTLFLAFSVQKNPGAAYQECKFMFFWNIKLQLASINLMIFYIGVGLLALGFVFQIIEKINT
ncbi:MAG: hypothetical protein ABIA67_04410 [Candidatus Margulisiibacteriota bacterium]